MKSVSFIIGLFVFFTTIIISMVWIIKFQVQSDAFLFNTKQLHRTLSMQCLNEGCSESSLISAIKNELKSQFPNYIEHGIVIETLHFNPFVLELNISIEVPSQVKGIYLTYSKVMIEVNR